MSYPLRVPKDSVSDIWYYNLYYLILHEGVVTSTWPWYMILIAFFMWVLRPTCLDHVVDSSIRLQWPISLILHDSLCIISRWSKRTNNSEARTGYNVLFVSVKISRSWWEPPRDSVVVAGSWAVHRWREGVIHAICVRSLQTTSECCWYISKVSNHESG